jgi:hypothetical protein
VATVKIPPTSITARDDSVPAEPVGDQESALAKARRQARDGAAYAEAQQVVLDSAALAAVYDSAEAAWRRASADPIVGVEGLFTAFVALRCASAARAAAVSQAGAVLDSIRPRRSPVSGEPIQHVNDGQDYLVSADFGPALESAIRARVAAAAADAARTVLARTDSAGQAAADTVA